MEEFGNPPSVLSIIANGFNELLCWLEGDEVLEAASVSVLLDAA